MEEKDLISFGIDHGISPQLPVVKELRAISKGIKELAEKEQPKEERPEVQKISLEGAEVITIKGEKGDKGDRGDKGDQGDRGTNGTNGKDGKNGENGKDGTSPDLETIAYEASKLTEAKLAPLIPKIEDIEKDLPKLGDKIRDALELLQGEDRLDKSAIKGLEELEKELRDLIGTSTSRHTGIAFVGDRLKVDDFTALTDGSTKSFYLEGNPRNLNTVKVWGSDFPFIMTHGKGFTITGKLLTLADDVDAPLTGAKLVCEYTI